MNVLTSPCCCPCCLACVCCCCCCRDAWHALQASRDPAVLCEVVSCMPQLMAALGPVLTHREMFPALAGLLQSHLSWIAGQLVLVMADLLPLLPSSGHELLLKVGWGRSGMHMLIVQLVQRQQLCNSATSLVEGHKTWLELLHSQA